MCVDELFTRAVSVLIIIYSRVYVVYTCGAGSPDILHKLKTIQLTNITIQL